MKPEQQESVRKTAKNTKSSLQSSRVTFAHIRRPPLPFLHHFLTVCSISLPPRKREKSTVVVSYCHVLRGLEAVERHETDQKTNHICFDLSLDHKHETLIVLS